LEVIGTAHLKLGEHIKALQKTGNSLSFTVKEQLLFVEFG